MTGALVSWIAVPLVIAVITLGVVWFHVTDILGPNDKARFGAAVAAVLAVWSAYGLYTEGVAASLVVAVFWFMIAVAGFWQDLRRVQDKVLAVV